ncbi:TetR/AcrR family transcriptional regulator [Oceanobacter sp. 4_MG-2023]|uniref:TetR/AcrR family transcriptional regulator n=1 Tax=Oceanobacter sp. 4_MG-2023 TaxID=3062623 RepID=UPI002732F28C|nr:TetR/AcrR family transcriptional regulator [Oceanobacter sp. 4_MG-2023]MDP2549012.1 TetR/AcrR family transcriptional regulator [Oceanobacter sp. 4_MG-2023]
MPKKPFSAEEIAHQRERIMDSAASIMADVGFHYLSMRKLAAELGMTASNIYNYFPSKESLLLHIRRRGFEMLFQNTRLALMDSQDAVDSLHRLAHQLTCFARDYAGYYQLMFQPPRIRPGSTGDDDGGVTRQLARLLDEWQHQAQMLLTDAIDGLAQRTDVERQRVTLYFLTAIHGLVDCYQYQALPQLLEGVELIPEDMVRTHTDWLVEAVKVRVVDLV